MGESGTSPLGWLSPDPKVGLEFSSPTSGVFDHDGFGPRFRLAPTVPTANALTGVISGVGGQCRLPRCPRPDRSRPVRSLCAPQGRQPGEWAGLPAADHASRARRRDRHVDGACQPHAAGGRVVIEDWRGCKRPKSSTPPTSTSSKRPRRSLRARTLPAEQAEVAEA